MKRALAVVAGVTAAAWVIDGPSMALAFAGIVTVGSLVVWWRAR